MSKLTNMHVVCLHVYFIPYQNILCSFKRPLPSKIKTFKVLHFYVTLLTKSNFVHIELQKLEIT